jgi:thiamine biosynthesis lipoprotein
VTFRARAARVTALAFATTLASAAASRAHDAAPADAPANDAIVEVHFAMGTPVAITARGDDEASTRAAVRAAFREIRRLEAILTAWEPSSETSRINRTAGAAASEVAPELAEVLAAALRLSRDTDGAFSVLVGPIVDAWRDADPDAPQAARLAHATALARRDDLTLDGRRVALRRAGMRLDLDGIAKGYAADRALALLRTHGVRAAIVNLGGSSMAAFGDAGDGGRGWPVEVPLRGDVAPATVRLVDEALSASASGAGDATDGGPARRRVIVDPRSGRRIARDATAVVVQPSATDAEAWSKALLVRGSDALPRLARHGAQAILQDEPDGPHCTARFRNLPGVCKVPRPAAASRRPLQAQERLGG